MGAIDDNTKSSELNRGSSLRTSVRFSHVQGEDDDYDLQAMGIADGFRPVDAPQTQTLGLGTATTLQNPPTTPLPPLRPSSTTKPPQRTDSFALQHDGSSNESDSGTSPSRVSGHSTGSPFVDPDEPYEGPSGPSHPYQMYPQNVRVARTASLATTSTAPISERSYNGPSGPAHPYGMYPQNTIPEAGGMPSQTAQGEITVGFPGTTDNYQRRIGPDGEDVADLIGPDGHTEQLPPYTRYPEETYHRKALGMETPQPAPVQPLLAIPGAGGIGVATRNPEFASTEDLGDLNSPQSRQSLRSFTSDGSRNELNPVSRTESEIKDEKNSLKEWQVTAKRRVWGIVPCWAILLASIVLVLMGVILGSVIGTLVNPHGKGKGSGDGPPSPALSPGNWDTQPLETLPPDLPPLEVGNFTLPLMNNRMSNTCFSQPPLAQAWNCDLFFFPLAMHIKKLDGQPNTSNYAIDITYNDTYSMKNHVYTYGMQPPDITDVKLKLVTDVHEGARGPAWNFEIAYNKTVIVRNQFLEPSATPSASGQPSRRMLFGGGFKRKGIAQVGETPWICHWDNTIIEAFVYAGQNNSISRPLSNPPPPTASSTDDGHGKPGPTPGAGGNPPGVENGQSKPTDGPHGGDPLDYHTSTPSPDGPPGATSTTPPASSSTGKPDKDYPPMPINPVPPYPRVIKVEEHRNSGKTTKKPWCEQVRIVGEYQEAVANTDANGNPIQIIIDENEGDFNDSGSKRSVIEHFLANRSNAKAGSDMSECGCMWWLS
ncbi:hypothetical protein F5Y04DRAFT_192892 [Hypomontagnella monticulosa]|nr:hypothetical protein F5Y04DRAFT_192892 [Hypomontagnella monticulosa]